MNLFYVLCKNDECKPSSIKYAAEFDLILLIGSDYFNTLAHLFFGWSYNLRCR